MPTKVTTEAELIKVGAANVMSRLHEEMTSEMEVFTGNKSLSKEEVNKGVFLVLDAYQTACLSMVAYLNETREATGRKVEMVICHDGEDIVVPPSDGTMN